VVNLTLLSRLLAGRAEAFCQQYLPAGRREGPEWLVGDVTGAEGRSLAVQLEGPKAGLWNDRADSSQHGDLLDLLAVRLGTKIKAADEARAFLGLPAWQPGAGNGQVRPAFNPLHHPFTPRGSTEARRPTAAWPYHDADGNIFAYVCRFDLPGGKKDVLPLRLMDGQWRWKGWRGDDPHPLYAQHLLASRPDAPVLIVEGEKTADAAQRLFPDYVVTTWQGGSKAVEKADFTPLLKRSTPLVLWPDNDDAGHLAMRYVRARFPASHPVLLPKGLPEGWDVADPCPQDISLRGLLDGARNPPAHESEAPCPYRCLGVSNRQHHYLIRADGTLYPLKADQHTELAISDIAPDEYWEGQGIFFQNKSTALDWKKIAKHMMKQSRRAGFFSPDRLRGRGVWHDEGRIVLHAGESLFVDGQPVALGAIQSRYVYEHGDHMPVDLSAPLTSNESSQLHDLCLLLPWGNQNAPWMFCGHLFVSLITGCLSYRPNLYLFGEADSGKSWTIERVIRPVWGPFCIPVSGSTTETAYRQVGQRDALTFLVDEFETESESAEANMRRVLILMRQSTTDTDAKIYRGTPEGRALAYSLKNNFIFASISILPTGRADESRITALELRRRADQEPFHQLLAIAARTVDSTLWCRRFQARAVLLARQTLDAIPLFTSALRLLVDDTRSSLQLGTLAAGCWMASCDHPPTPDEAAAWLSTLDFSDFLPVREDSDHQQCLNHLLEARIRRDNNTLAQIGPLLLAATSPSDPDIEARRLLLQHGIRVDISGETFEVANRHSLLHGIFRNTRWNNKWKDQLGRIGSRTPTTSFGPVKSRAVQLPRSLLK
jgi:putative DNA primase/helicase